MVCLIDCVFFYAYGGGDSGGGGGGETPPVDCIIWITCEETETHKILI